MSDEQKPRKSGRKPKESTELLRNHTHIVLTDNELEDLKALSLELGCSQTEVVRRGIATLKERILKEAESFPLELRMAGDASTLQKKKLVIQAFKLCANVAVAADRAGVTTRTVQYWAEKDPIFAELCVEAKAFSVGRVQCRMYKDAMEGNTSAQFGILNAFDPNFGAIRSQMLQQVIRPLIDGVIEHARRLIPDTENIERFALECGRIGERVAIAAIAGKRR